MYIETKTEEVQVSETKAKLDQSISKEQLNTLKELSKEIFGVSSKYRKLYSYMKPVTKMIKETVPGKDGAEDTVVEKEVYVLKNGSKQHIQTHRSTEEVIQVMMDFKARRDEILKQIEAHKEEEKAKKEAEKALNNIQEELTGSAI